MGKVMHLLATPFTGMQTALIICIALVCVAGIAVNLALVLFSVNKRKRGRLCNSVLQQRREQLLEELYDLRRGKLPEKFDDEDDDEKILSDGDAAFAEVNDENGEFFNAEIMAVKDMSSEMRERLGLTGAEHARKRYFVRSDYGFEAKLRASAESVKQRYKSVISAFRMYSGTGFKSNFRGESVTVNEDIVARLLFRGKNLCVALAIDPKNYDDSKYCGEDVSDRKEFEGTPMLIKISSDRRLDRALFLVSRLCESKGAAALDTPVKGRFDLAAKSRGDLFVDGKIKYSLLGEAVGADGFVDDEEVETAGAPIKAGILTVDDLPEAVRQKVGLTGSQHDGKKYFVRYGYGFEARLHGASDEVKARYGDLLNEIGLYKKLKVSESFRHRKLSFQGRTVGLIFFRGETLCVAYALDPKEYENTKYRGEDLSSNKRFSATPMALRLTSERKLGYAKYLLTRLAGDKLIDANAAPVRAEHYFDDISLEELIVLGLVKVYVIGEAS